MFYILKGVKWIHEKQIIHRDLKTDNIMFSNITGLSVKIIDMGLSTRKDKDHYMFPKCGTPGYVAPEVVNLEDKVFKYSEKCDLFSVGSIFYKLLVGVNLFPGNKFEQVLRLNK